MNEINDLLNKKGLSRTKVRVDILSVFLKSNKPLSIYDLKKIPSLKHVNESSIYRNLNRFEEAAIIRAVPSSNSFQSYELLLKGKHHHHIVCEKCKVVQCLSVCNIEKELKKLAKSVGFSLEAHALELSGRCKKCMSTFASTAFSDGQRKGEGQRDVIANFRR